MIPGKKYGPEDFLRMVWHRRWLVIAPFLLTAVGTAAVSSQLPNVYKSQTMILIVPQRVPENYVAATITTPLEDRLQIISEQILNRTRLERIIQEFNLYEKERKVMIMEDVFEQMRTKDIKVNIVPGRSRRNDASAFTVSFQSNNARTAMLVTERLATLFINENLQDRSVLADVTSQFLEEQVQDAKRRLTEHEKKLEAYRRANQGTLPTELQSNLQGIQTAQNQIHTLQESLLRDQDRKSALERQIQDLQLATPAAAAPPVTLAPGADPATAAGQTAAQRLEAARMALTGMEMRLKAEHPDIVRLKKGIRDLEREAEKEAMQRPISDATPAATGVSVAEAARLSRISALQGEVNSINRRLTAGQQEQQRLSDLMATYQRRVEATPARESELVALMRDYDTLQRMYTDLLTKNEASKVAANLEKKQIGEQFKVLDGARLPERPISPDRIRMNLMGATAGLALGLALVFLLEWRDTSLRTEADVLTALSLPVLAIVPAIETKKEVVTRRRRRLVLAAAAALVLLSTAAATWKLHLIERLVN